MKHLKSYSKNESYLNIEEINDLKDILLELSDIGFSTKCIHNLITSNIIRIEKNGKIFKYVEVKDVIDRIDDYLTQNKYTYSIYINNVVSDFTKQKSVRSITIYF